MSSFDSFRVGYDNLEQNKTPEKQETSGEKKERLVVFELQQKGITYKTLKFKIKEIEDKKALLEIMPDDEDIKQQVEKLEKELKSKAIVIKVEKGDTLRGICKKEYGKGSISTKILIPKLGYKEKIKVGEELPIPLKEYIAKLVKGMTEDLSDDYQKKQEDQEEQDKQKFQTKQETNTTKSDLIIYNISKPISEEKQNQEKVKEDFEKEQFQQLQNVFIEKITSLYANYLEKYLDNSYFENSKDQQKLLSFLKNDLIDFVKRLQHYNNSPAYIGKEVKIQINQHIQTFDEDVLNQLNILLDFIEDIIKAKNDKQIKQIYKSFIFRLREINNNDSLSLFNQKDANLYKSSYELLVNENLDFITNEEIRKRLEKIDQLDVSFINNVEKLYHQDPININGEKLYKEYWNKNGNIHINEKWISIIHNQIRNQLIKNGINIKGAIDNITKKLDKLFLYNKTDYLSIYEKIKKDLKQNGNKEKLGLFKRNFERNGEIDLDLFKQFYLNLEKAYLLENIKLIGASWLLQSQYINNNEIKKYRQENKVFDLYCDVNGIGSLEFSDIQENMAKFWLKELPTEVVFLALSAFGGEMIVGVRMAQLTRRLKQAKTIDEIERLKDKINTLKILSYPTTGVGFHYSYTGLENIKNGEDILKGFSDIKGLTKDMILIGILKGVNEFKPLRNANLSKDFDKFRNMSIIDIVEEVGKTHSKLTSKVLGINVETGIVYTAGNGVNIIFNDSLQDERDLLIAFGLVVGLRGANKLLKYVAYKDKNGEIKLRELEEEKLKPVLDFVNKDGVKILKDFKTSLEKKYKKSVEELTKKELDFELRHLKLELRAKTPDTYKGQKRIVVNALMNEFKRYVEERKVKDNDPDTGYNQTKTIGKLPGELAEVIEKAKFKDGNDYIEKLLGYFQKQGKIPILEEFMPYIDMYVETRSKEEESIAENYYKKASVSEEAKQKLKKELIKEYKEVLEKIEQANKGRTVEEKIDKLIKGLKEINEVEYQRIIERLDKKKMEIIKEKRSDNKPEI